MAGQVLGFVGVGRMGGPMAGRLIDAGYALRIFDTDAAAMRALAGRGAKPCASAAELGASASTVLASLPTPDVVRAVTLGERGVATGGAVRRIVDLSTTGPRVAAELARALAPRGIAWVDAPVSGGVAGARAGTLAVMVACNKDTLAEVEPILKAFGRVFFAGERPGMAQTAKLANNLLSAAAMAVTSEAIVMGVKSGLDPRVMLDIINAGTGRNTATETKFPRDVLPRTFGAGFATGLSYKDVRLCIDEAEALGVPMVVGAAVREMLAITQARFGAESDFTSIARVVEEWAGVEIHGGSQGN
ncbi:MAG: NAD(P)-dependent oxidoreductase [Rhodospirillales bacterium]